MATSGTTDGQTENRTPDGIDHIGEVEILVVAVGGITVSLADGEETGGRHSVGIFRGITGFSNDVAGDLLSDKLIDRQIFVE